MKKNNEGYALVLVLVVITVLCLVALAMTAASLKNLHNQQKSIERMQAKYDAQGEIEKVIAGFEEKIKPQGSLMEISLGSTLAYGGMINAAVDAIPVSVSVEYCMPEDKIEDLSVQLGIDHDYLLLKLESSTESGTTVQCTIKITGSITTGVSGQYIVALSGMKWEYVSYTITHNEGGGAG